MDTGDGAGGGRRRRLFLAAGFAAVLAAIVAAWFTYIPPRLVVRSPARGGTIVLPGKYAPAVPRVRAYLNSADFLGDMEEACPGERRLLRKWRSGPVSFNLAAGPGGDILLTYVVPLWYLRFFSIGKPGMAYIPGVANIMVDETRVDALCGPDTWLPLLREAQDRNALVRSAMADLVQGKLEESGKHERKAEGAAP